MKYLDDALSEKHGRLSKIIKKSECFSEAVSLFYDIHSALHEGTVYGIGKTYADILSEDFPAECYGIIPSKSDDSAAWHLWHMTRIEDLTMGFLVSEEGQVYDSTIAEKISAGISDTGNSMTAEEELAFGKSINIPELLAYRQLVGNRTKDIVGALSCSDMKRKVSEEGINNIRLSGGIAEREASLMLLDYWGGKDVAGLLLMPATRHLMLHLNGCFKAKERILSGKKPYLKR